MKIYVLSSEIYKKGQLRKGFLDEEPSGEMAREDWLRMANPEDSFIKNGKTYWIYETKEIKVKGYFDGKTRRFPK